MKTTTRIIALPLAGILLLASGCGTGNPDAAKYAYWAARDFYGQPNTAEIERIEVQQGGSYKVEISGPATVVRSAPIPQKQIIPRDPSVLNKAIEGITKLGIGYFVADAFKGATTTRDPVVVNQPPPLLVRPEVITVPAP